MFGLYLHPYCQLAFVYVQQHQQSQGALELLIKVCIFKWKGNVKVLEN